MLNSIYTAAAAKLSRSSGTDTQTEQNAPQLDATNANEVSDSLDRPPARRSGQSIDVRRAPPSPSGSGSQKVKL